MRVNFSGQRFTFPHQCACCGGPPDRVYYASASKTKGKRVKHTTTKGWEFPYCSNCIRHVNIYQSASVWAFLVILIAAGAGYCLYSAAYFGPILFAGIIPTIAIFILTRMRASRACSKACACSGPAVSYLGWHGSEHSFYIRSKEYAARLLQSNSRKLVNASTDVHSLLESGRQEAMQVSVPPIIAHAKSETDEREQIIRYVSRLESAKGPVTRKAILEDALKRIESSTLRDHLAMEASRIEVNAVLEKADQLRTLSAKKRVIAAAIEELKNDRVPDSQQQTQLQRLESALAELD